MLSQEGRIVIKNYLKDGMSQTAIAKKLGVSRRTVYRYGRNGKEETVYGPRRPQPSKLDRFKPYLRGRLRHFPDLTARRLLQEIQDLGYEGQYTALKNYLRTIRPKPVAAMEVRYETNPGDQAQVDFGDFRTPFGRVFALVVTLSWSRLLWVGWSFQSDMLTLMGMLHCAFLFFGGVPRRLLFDRMKTVVASSDREGGAVFNAEFLRFCRHYGFRPQACHPCRPQTKGKVERTISYLRSGFFYGRTFRDLADLEGQSRSWLQEVANRRIHGTTHEIPAERWGNSEKSLLQAMPVAPYCSAGTLVRRSSRDGFLSWGANLYSVPEGFHHALLEVRATVTHLEILEGGSGQLVARHLLSRQRGERIVDPSHSRARTTGEAVTAASQRQPPLPSQEEDDPSPAIIPHRAWESVQVQKRPLDFYDRSWR